MGDALASHVAVEAGENAVKPEAGCVTVIRSDWLRVPFHRPPLPDRVWGFLLRLSCRKVRDAGVLPWGQMTVY